MLIVRCSAQGISLSANIAELAAYSVMISYNVNNSEFLLILEFSMLVRYST